MNDLFRNRKPEHRVVILRKTHPILLPLITASLAALVALTLTGCGARPSKKPAELKATEPIQILWPGPPDRARFKYEWRLKTLEDIQLPNKEESFLKSVTGGNAGDRAAFIRPVSVAARNGRIFVADGQGAAITVFDVPRRKVFQFGKRPPHTLPKPVSIAVDGNNFVYVLDGKLKKVIVFDSLGLYQFEVGDAATLVRPASVAVNRDGSKIYIVDRGTPEGDDHRVHVYDKKGQKIIEIGPRGSKDGQLNIPLDATVDENGLLYIADSGNFRVQIFSPEGKFLFAFGDVGARIGQFSRPRGIAVGPDGNIYVSDAVFNNVQIFNPKGELLMPLGRFAINLDNPGNYGLISGIAVDETNRLYIIDQYYNKIEVFRHLK